MNKTDPHRTLETRGGGSNPACHLTGEDHHAHVKRTTVLQLPIYQHVAPTQTASVLGHCSYHHSPSTWYPVLWDNEQGLEVAACCSTTRYSAVLPNRPLNAITRPALPAPSLKAVTCILRHRLGPGNPTSRYVQVWCYCYHQLEKTTRTWKTITKVPTDLVIPEISLQGALMDTILS